MLRSNNKVLGSNFEAEMCALLARHGYWVHFIQPDARGAQPFDIVAVSDGKAYAFDCKTLCDSRKSFPLSRLEENQKLAFERWGECGNGNAYIALKHCGRIYLLSYRALKKYGLLAMDSWMPIEKWFLYEGHNEN